jgi:KaiC/GvpD/RAD55 family RecA-like ATPase
MRAISLPPACGLFDVMTDTSSPKPIYVPLRGEDPGGQSPKAPSVKEWSSEDYRGVDREYGGWVGLRTDGLVVVDCDSDDAVHLWREIGDPTFEVKTPRGRHFYYRWSPGSPSTPSVAVMPGIDIRAGRGAQVVVPPTPGYEDGNELPMTHFRPAWMPEADGDGSPADTDEWEVIPEGRRNETLVNIAGALRRQGMSAEQIAYALASINKRCCVPPLDLSEIVTIAESAGRYDPQPDWSVDIEGVPHLGAKTLEEVTIDMRDLVLPPPAAWHWHPYLPKGRLVLMDGSEGIGKGLMCAHLATKLVNDGLNGLWGSTEDDPEEDIQRRLLAAGYDRTLNATIRFFTVDPRLPQDIFALESLIEQAAAGFLILDPGRSFLAPPDNVKGFSFNDEASIRPGLESLNRLAKRAGCTIIFVHHWNKNTLTSVQYRSGGTGAFAQVVRHRITLAWVGPTDGGEGAFAVTKSNLGSRGNVHAYTIEPDAALDTARLVLGEPDPRYRDLGEWLKAKEAHAWGVSIDTTEEDMAWITAQPTGVVINRKILRTERDLPSHEADRLIELAHEAGLVNKVGNQWRRSQPLSSAAQAS